MLKQWLIDYSHDVVNGDVIACEKHRWACLRFLNDLDLEGTEDFPYIFDEEQALKFLNWMHLFKHTKGVLAGERITPAPIQVFIFANVYGWIHMKTGNRRFRKAYWQVGRKNAKSQSLACVGTYECAPLGESMAEIYIGATKKEQAGIVWNEIKAQILGSNFIREKFRIANGKITHIKTGGFIQALSKDEGKMGDGKNVQCGLVDEFHLHPTAEIYDVLVSGSGARPQPLMFIITTAGFELNNPCYAVEYKLVSKILNPDDATFNHEYFVMINELDKNDNIQDETVWEKANPILCSYDEGRNFIKSELKNALDAPEKMRSFLTKHMNIWVNMRENGYMNMKKWAECYEHFDFDEFRECECTIGVDLAAKLDLTSVGFEFKMNDNYYVLSHSFMPEERLNEKMKTDNVPYSLWAEQGWITLTEGDVVDQQYIISYIEKIIEEYKIIPKEICSDPWNATQFMQMLSDNGHSVIEIRQGIATLGAATKDFREKVYMGRVKHNGNPVLTYAMGNCITKADANENIMLDKAKSKQRIDPVASLINSHVRAMLDINTKSVYEDRGLTML